MLTDLALLIEGEAGIGKTTLVRARIEVARAAGIEVLAARPTQAEAALSFVALGDVLEGVLDEVLDELPQPQRQALEAALLLGDPGAADAVSTDPRAVAVAVLGALRTLARSRRVLVAVDDVQWLDAPSATALGFAGRRLPAEGVRFLLARRRGHEDLVTGELETVESLTVGPLSAGALHRLVRTRLDVVLARPELRRLQDLSGGNPFYALELARAYRAGTIELRREDRLPPTLEALVGHRIAALPSKTRDALAAASALARPSAELVAPSRVLEPAVSAGVIAVEGGGDPVRPSAPRLRGLLGPRRCSPAGTSCTARELGRGRGGAGTAPRSVVHGPRRAGGECPGAGRRSRTLSRRFLSRSRALRACARADAVG